MRNGILVGGNWIIDEVKLIDSYPQEEKLVNILEQFSSNGGSAYNILKDLYKMQVNFPLEGIGLVGSDERGEWILNECKQMSIDVRQLQKTDKASTSYTDVMSVKSTGKRTFFHQRGANALLDTSNFDFSRSGAKIFHLGYLLLLDKLDIVGDDGLTGAATVFRKAKQAGLKTSTDIVSENSDRFRSIIPSSLPFVDILFINEFEAAMLTGMETSCNGNVLRSSCYEAASRVLAMGVNEWVVLHFPEGVIAVGKNGQSLFQPSVNLPAGMIAGAVGAGDAFAAGVLAGVHDNRDFGECLKLGVCAAASSLMGATSSDSIVPIAACLQLAKEYGFKNEPVEA
jgi:sugar/nucleoside kinase (ribokinase family)